MGECDTTCQGELPPEDAGMGRVDAQPLFGITTLSNTCDSRLLGNLNDGEQFVNNLIVCTI